MLFQRGTRSSNNPGAPTFGSSMHGYDTVEAFHHELNANYLLCYFFTQRIWENPRRTQWSIFTHNPPQVFHLTDEVSANWVLLVRNRRTCTDIFRTRTALYVNIAHINSLM